MESVLILTPLAIEHSALSAALGKSCSASENDQHGVKILRAGDLNLDLAVGGHGKVQFALSTQLLIQKLRPRLVICAGAAGRLSPDLQALDVVVGDVTIEHDFRLRFVERPLPRFPGCARTLETLRGREWEGFRTHFGPLASGDEDIIEEGRAAEIRNLTGALAVAWEGAGGARACRIHGVPYVEIRVITDSADSMAPRDFTDNVKHGMRNVAEVIRQLI